MDFGKFKYEEKKRAADARKRQATVELKEIKVRPKTDDHDRFRAGQLPPIRSGTHVDEHLVRAGTIGILVPLQGRGHRAADQPIHDPLGAGQLRRAVVSEDERLPHE